MVPLRDSDRTRLILESFDACAQYPDMVAIIKEIESLPDKEAGFIDLCLNKYGKVKGL
jgi:hypothetical protein